MTALPFACMLAVIAGAATLAILQAKFALSDRPSAGPTDVRAGFAARIARFAARLAPLGKRDESVLRLKLARAGMPVSPTLYYGTSLSFFGCATAGIALACGALLPAEPVYLRPCATVALSAACALAPFAVLASRASRRKRAIERDLPTALDMLSASVEAGLTFERSMRTVSGRRKGALSDELAKVDRDMSMLGYTRPQALRRMADRCDSEEVSLFVSAIVASSRSGAPLAKILKGQASSARKRRFQRMLSEANKIPTKMVFPLAFLIMPSAFIVAVSPAAISIAKNVTEVF